MAQTELVGGPFDGGIIDNMHLGPHDSVTINGSVRYVSTGRHTPSGAYEAVYDDSPAPERPMLILREST